MAPRIVLATVGSLGDLHPFLAVGRALVARGAVVEVACTAEYRSKVEAAGLAFRAVRPSFEDLQQQLGMDRAQLTRAIVRRNDFLLRRLIVPNVRAAYDDLLPVVRGADLVMASTLAFGAQLAAERCAVPRAAVVLQPVMFLSAYDPPEMPRAQWVAALLRRLGPGATRHALRWFKRALALQLRPLRALRRQIGLAPTRRNPLFEGQFAAAGVLGLYSSVMGEIRPDYPPRSLLTGFARFDADAPAGDAPPAGDRALREFLERGARPIVFSLGSLIVHSPGEFYRAGAAAARLLGRRAVLLVGAAAVDEYAELAGEDVYVAGYVPHSCVFPAAEVIVHHGGIGTLAQALCAGRPQLIVPFYADQADNAARMVRWGAARTVSAERFRAQPAAQELLLLMTGAAYRSRAAEARQRVANEDGAAVAAAWAMNAIESRIAR